MRLHQVIMFLMGLDIAPKLESAVFVIIQIKTHHKHLGTESVRHAIMGGKHFEPEDTQVDHFFKHEGRKMVKRNRMVHAACSFFKCSDETFHFRDVFVIGTNIETRAGNCQGSMECLKFIISMNHLYKKAAGAIEAHDC